MEKAGIFKEAEVDEWIFRTRLVEKESGVARAEKYKFEVIGEKQHKILFSNKRGVTTYENMLQRCSVRKTSTFVY